jgi:hypothetical protein
MEPPPLRSSERGVDVPRINLVNRLGSQNRVVAQRQLLFSLNLWKPTGPVCLVVETNSP